MTLADITTKNGFYLLSSADHPNFVQPVVVLGATAEKQGRAWTMVVSQEVPAQQHIKPGVGVVIGPLDLQECEHVRQNDQLLKTELKTCQSVLSAVKPILQEAVQAFLLLKQDALKDMTERTVRELENYEKNKTIITSQPT